MEERRNGLIYDLVSGWITLGSEKNGADKNWYTLVFLLVFPVFALVMGGVLFGVKVCRANHVENIWLLLLSLSSLPLTCILTLLIAQAINPRRPILERIRWAGWQKDDVSAALKLLGIVLPAVLILNIISMGVFKLFGWKISDPELPLLLRNGSWGMVGIIAVGAILVAPIMEEILFRRMIFTFIALRINTLAGVLITSVIFAFVHDCAVQLPALFMLGVVLQLSYIARRSLAVPIMLHLFNNAFAVGLMVLGRLFHWEWVFDL